MSRDFVTGAGTYYSLLEVDESASPIAIRAAYLKLVKEYHPDSIPAEIRERRIGKEAEERFKLIARAYETLSDPAKRSRYDDALRSRRSRDAPPTWVRETAPERSPTSWPSPSSPKPSPKRHTPAAVRRGFRVTARQTKSLLWALLLGSVAFALVLRVLPPAPVPATESQPAALREDSLEPRRRPIRPPPSASRPLADIAQMKWEKLVPTWGSDSPEIAGLPLDPTTQSTRLVMRHPTAMHLPRHWHTGNEDVRILKGSYVFESNGRRDTLNPGSSISFPARTPHQAWAPEGGMFVVTIDRRWDLNWVDGAPQRPAKP